MVLWIVLDLDRFYSYSQVLEENGATDNGGKPTAHDCIRWIVVELLRWRNVEVEWGPVATASARPYRRRSAENCGLAAKNSVLTSGVKQLKC